MTVAASELAAALLETGSTLSCAESCTGGLAAAALTSIPGSSAFFQGGVVAYSNSAKASLLGVPEATILAHGAVSGETALAMASGAAKAFGTAFSFAITGIAGPDGGSVDKPVGTVWFGFATPVGASAELRRFDGSRDEIRRRAAEHAIARMTELARSSTSSVRA